MSFSIFYIVQPPRYSAFSVPLLASIRKYFAPDVRIIGYCPEECLAEIPVDVRKFHDHMGAEIRPIRTEGRWSQPYPHGNKILAALEARDTDFSMFVDTDVVFTCEIDWNHYANDTSITCSPATSMS